MKTFIEKLISSFKEVVSVYPWLKLAIASLVGVLGGSSFITFRGFNSQVQQVG